MLYCPLYFFFLLLLLLPFQQPNNTRFSDSSSPGHKAEIKVGRFISQKQTRGQEREQASERHTANLLRFNTRRSLLCFQQSSRSFLSALVVKSTNVLVNQLSLGGALKFLYITLILIPFVAIAYIWKVINELLDVDEHRCVCKVEGGKIVRLSKTSVHNKLN